MIELVSGVNVDCENLNINYAARTCKVKIAAVKIALSFDIATGRQSIS